MKTLYCTLYICVPDEKQENVVNTIAKRPFFGENAVQMAKATAKIEYKGKKCFIETYQELACN